MVCTICILAFFHGVASLAHATPVTVDGTPFVLVARGSHDTQLFGLTSDAQGRVYIGNNSSDTTGIPLQLFDPALFAGLPLVLQNFGPPVGDADGIASGNGFIYAADRDEGIRQVALPGGESALYLDGAATNAWGSPLLFRPADGHLFVGGGGGTGITRIDEYDAVGTFVITHPTDAEVETMTYDPATGLIYYAASGSVVRALNPLIDDDFLVGIASGTVDGGLAFDPGSGLLFVGTANGMNPGLVETIDPATGEKRPFASGFDGSLGILREPITGDLYFLEANQLYRLPSAQIALGNHFVCYQSAPAKGQQKFAQQSVSLRDQLGGPHAFRAKNIVETCNPGNDRGEGVPNPTVHEAGLSLKTLKGTPKFVPVKRVVSSQFGTYTLKLLKVDSLFDVTPQVIGTIPPPPFAGDPTSAADVNRFKCYSAKLAKGQPKFVPGKLTLTEDFYPGGQAFSVGKITKVCAPADKNGETPGAEARSAHLLCVSIKLPKGSPKFVATTVATHNANFGPHVLVAKKPKELCVPALMPK